MGVLGGKGNGDSLGFIVVVLSLAKVQISSKLLLVKITEARLELSARRKYLNMHAICECAYFTQKV